MNVEQVKSATRWTLATFGPLIISHGWASSGTLEMASGALVSVVPFVWSMFAHTQASAIAVVSEIAKDPASPVKAVIAENTSAGSALASATSGPTVIAGSIAATTLAAG